jgi:hypothetical protein
MGWRATCGDNTGEATARSYLDELGNCKTPRVLINHRCVSTSLFLMLECIDCQSGLDTSLPCYGGIL